jgi:hypothetical protein
MFLAEVSTPKLSKYFVAYYCSNTFQNSGFLKSTFYLIRQCTSVLAPNRMWNVPRFRLLRLVLINNNIIISYKLISYST